MADWDWGLVHAHCLREAEGVLGLSGSAEDAAQEATVRAWRRRDNCQTPDRPQPWVATIARNVYRQLQTSRRMLTTQLEIERSSRTGLRHAQTLIDRIARDLRASIVYALEHRAPALAHARQFNRGIGDERTDTFVGMYVNELTQDYGEEGRAAVHELLRRGEAVGAFNAPVHVDFVG